MIDLNGGGFWAHFLGQVVGAIAGLLYDVFECVSAGFDAIAAAFYGGDYGYY